MESSRNIHALSATDLVVVEGQSATSTATHTAALNHAPSTENASFMERISSFISWCKESPRSYSDIKEYLTQGEKSAKNAHFNETDAAAAVDSEAQSEGGPSFAFVVFCICLAISFWL